VKVIKGVQAFFEQLVLKGNMCRHLYGVKRTAIKRKYFHRS